MAAKSCPWAKESDLCAAFAEAATKQGWTVYPETGGWDLLLVRNADGFQIGVEAKLSLNAKVLCQVLSREGSYSAGRGPDCWAVLVPEVNATNGLDSIASRLGITVITAWRSERLYGPPGATGTPHFEPRLPDRMNGAGLMGEYEARWVERAPDQRIALPEYVPDVAGGSSAPVQLTEWKIKALKVAVVLEMLGSITRAEFKALRIDSRRWTDSWLVSDGNGAWTARPNMPNFKGQHPVNYEQIKADWPKWSTVLPARLVEHAA